MFLKEQTLQDLTIGELPFLRCSVYFESRPVQDRGTCTDFLGLSCESSG